MFARSDAPNFGALIAMDDCAPAINAALASGQYNGLATVLPAGTLRIKSPLVARNTSGRNRGGRLLYGAGSGLTVIRADFDGAHILDFDGSSHTPGRFFHGAGMGGFTIDGNKAGKTGQHGIRMNGGLFCRFEDVEVTNCAGDGIVSPVRPDIAANADFYESDPTFDRVRVTHCDGWGVNGASANGFNPVFNDFFVGANKAGGVWFCGVGLTMRNGSLAGNGYARGEFNDNHGTNLRTSGASRRTIIEQVEFDPDWGGVSTIDSHWDCLRAAGAVVLPSRFNMRVTGGAMRPLESMVVSRGTEHQASQGIRMIGPRVRLDTPGEATIFNIANRGNVAGFKIDDLQIENGGGATVTAFKGATEAQAFANNFTVQRHTGAYDIRGRAPLAVA